MKKLFSVLLFSIAFLAIGTSTFASTGDISIAAPYHLEDIKVKIERMDSPLATAASNAYSGLIYYAPASSISWAIALTDLAGNQLAKNSFWPNSEIIQLKSDGKGYNVLSKVNAVGFAYTYRLPSNYSCIAPLYLHLSDSYGADAYFSLESSKICNNVTVNGEKLSSVNVAELAPQSTAVYPLQVNSAAELAKIREYYFLAKSVNSPKVYLINNIFGSKHHVENMDSLRTWWAAFDKKIDILSDYELGILEDGYDIALRPGTLVKSVNSPKVYMVNTGGGLFHLSNEAEARKYAGSDWNKNIYIVSQSLIDETATMSYMPAIPDASYNASFPSVSNNVQVEYTQAQ